MSLSHDGYDFEEGTHGIVTPGSEFEPQITVGQFQGVNGESHLIHEATWGRDLFCELSIDGYATETALRAALDTIHSKVGTLTGTLTMAIGGNDTVFEQCTFLGLMVPRGSVFNDGATGNWVMLRGILRWRQRARNTV